jgi:hypothetical protein
MQLGITDLFVAGEFVTIRPMESWQYVCYEDISEIKIHGFSWKFLGYCTKIFRDCLSFMKIGSVTIILY